MKIVKFLFEHDKKPHRGLLPEEWVVVGYLVFTLLLMLFMSTRIVNPQAMLSMRLQVAAIIVAMWAVYRMVPCRFTRLLRASAQVALLSLWYPDTYEFNRLLPNLDHVFAQADQQLFGYQPALLFADAWSHPVFSELMHMGYASYFPLIALVFLFYFIYRNQEFGRATFIMLTSFFVFYLVFLFLPVAGPQFYYLAAGIDNIAHGVFPNVGDYFLNHQEMLPTPGWSDGLFYQTVCQVHAAGERPTAAFPSSHVGITMVLLLLAWRTGNRKLLAVVAFFFTLMCFSTVYIQAHYAVDALAGLVAGVVVYAALSIIYNKVAKN